MVLRVVLCVVVDELVVVGGTVTVDVVSLRRIRASARPTASARAASGCRRAAHDDAVEGRLAQPAVGAVADVEADQLVAAPADPQVLRASRRSAESEGASGSVRVTGTQLLAGLPVDVGGSRLDRGERLAPRGRRPQPVDLAEFMGADTIKVAQAGCRDAR